MDYRKFEEGSIELSNKLLDTLLKNTKEFVKNNKMNDHLFISVIELASISYFSHAIHLCYSFMKNEGVNSNINEIIIKNMENVRITILGLLNEIANDCLSEND